MFMQDLGEIEKVARLDPEVQEKYKLPPSVIVSFKMFDPQRDVIGVSPSSSPYCLPSN
jgi:hypothetical protein